MISEEKCFIAECDNCGDLFENYSGFSLFADRNSMIEDLSESGWYTDNSDIKNSKHYCHKCHSINDHDELIINTDRTKAQDK